MNVRLIFARCSLALLPLLAGTAAAVLPAAPAQAASCFYHRDPGNFWEYAGNYGGTTAVPSKTLVTSAGVEAQCLLVFSGHNPGGVDGVFGRNSQAAMKTFQRHMNLDFGAGLVEDGMPGPKSWPWLRWYAGLFG